MTSFHGRERDIGELGELLRERRLVTLWGVGGVAKTRLAIEAARSVRTNFVYGAVLVELAAVLDAGQVVTRIAAALKVTERSQRSVIDDVTFVLRHRQLLLVLDNCEHVLGVVADTAQRLPQGCARLSVMATSREPLRVASERVYVVAPLTLPEPLSAQVPSLPNRADLRRFACSSIAHSLSRRHLALEAKRSAVPCPRSVNVSTAYRSQSNLPPRVRTP